MIVYRITNPLSKDVIYIGVSENLETAKRNLYWSSNPGLATEITEIRAARLAPLIDVLEEVDEDKVKGRALHWRAFHREQGCKLHNAPDKHLPRRAAGRRQKRKVKTSTVDLEIPETLLSNKTFKKFFGGKGLIGPRIVELIMCKVEELEEQERWLNS